MRSFGRLLVGVLLILVQAPITWGASTLPIIPGEAGFGMDTPAGSGRHLDAPKTQIIRVTNLKPEGPGSLRAALEAEGPRVVVFEVSGNIDFSPLGHLQIRHPYVTVAGQTAPSPGITLKACELGIRTHDVLLQHIRIRVGDLLDPSRPLRNEAGWTQWSERDNMKVAGQRIVIDHCSFSWATDENVQSTARDVTFRHNIFSEGLDSTKHHKGGHSKALLILNQGKDHSQNVAVVGNLFAHNKDRCPEAAPGTRIAVINNLVYNTPRKPGIAMTVGNSPPSDRGGGIAASIIGNHLDRTPSLIRVIARNGSVGKIHLADYLCTYTDADGRAVDEHVPDLWNYPPGDGSHPNRPRTIFFTKWMDETVHPERSKAAEPPVVVPSLAIRPVREVRDWVLAHAGARPADRDPVDARIVREVRNRTGDVPESQDDGGGWPDLEENQHPLTLPPNPNGDDDGDGYTNLEEWLHTLAAEVEGAAR